MAQAGELRPGVSAEQATRTLSAALHGVSAAIAADPSNRDNVRPSNTVRDAITVALLAPATPQGGHQA
jgi:hypothetical protein